MGKIVNEKNFSDETLKKYVSSEIELIKQEKSKKENWKKNSRYSSQISVSLKED